MRDAFFVTLFCGVVALISACAYNGGKEMNENEQGSVDRAFVELETGAVGLTRKKPSPPHLEHKTPGKKASKEDTRLSPPSNTRREGNTKGSSRPPEKYLKRLGDVYHQTLYVIHKRESRFGADPRSHKGRIGPNGEQGAFQVTPIFIEDIQRLFGHGVSVYNNAQTRACIIKWLRYYGPRVKATTPYDLYELYRRGPTGYKRWKGKKNE